MMEDFEEALGPEHIDLEQNDIKETVEIIETQTEPDPDYFSKILLITDNMVLLDLLTAIFQQLGVRKIDEASTVHKVVRKVQGRLSKPLVSFYSLILIDFNSPSMQGTDTTNMIRNLLVNNQQILEIKTYFVCLTEMANHQSVQDQARKVGVDTILTTPLNLLEL